MDFNAWMNSWTLECAIPEGPFKISVRATDLRGSSDIDSIGVSTTGADFPARYADRSDNDAIGAWDDKHIAGTQLGPNRNGRKW